MSNLETDPVEVVAECLADEGSPESQVEILSPREVPLGGPRAMTVRRTLPQRQRSTIGGWCFIDHYGPQDVSASGGMRVPPHPHTGLQTVSWLFAGEIEHRDSVGSHAMVRPGELNLMTAGRGISHSEVSTPATTSLHGVQLWVALPAADRAIAPFFEHHAPPVLHREGAELRVFVGSLAGAHTDASVFSPLVGAQIDLAPGAMLELRLDPSFEHGILVDLGPVRVNDTDVARAELAYLAPASGPLTLTADVVPARVILLGGEPLGEELVMWWNFIGGSHDDIVAFRSEWQDDVIGGRDAHGRFGSIPEYDGAALPAPVLPTVRLKPRG